MFGLGAPELIVILVIILIVFGAGKLPQIGGALGKGIKEFREGAEGKGSETITTTTTTTIPPTAVGENVPAEQKKSGL